MALGAQRLARLNAKPLVDGVGRRLVALGQFIRIARLSLFARRLRQQRSFGGGMSMRRIATTARENWQQKVESQGFYFHSLEDAPYWDESVYYQFTSQEVDLLEKATYALDGMCLQAVQHVIDRNLFRRFGIPPEFVGYLVDSWEHDEISVYGRFDLAYDGRNPPKMLEYNADTPTSVLEAAAIQWFWFKDTQPTLDQFNSIHERLIEAWRAVAAQTQGTWYFTCLRGNLEDYMTTNYLRDTAMQAGIVTEYIDIELLGWNYDRRVFVDTEERPIGNCFKLYPWEWLLREQYSPHLSEVRMKWMEPAWKMILSNKAILPTLYELFPQSPYLLEASFTPLEGAYVRKPILGREGANIQGVSEGRIVRETDGPYPGPYVYQRMHALANFDGNYPVIGSWMVNGYACGIGIREDETPITSNTSRFVPHVFTH